MRDDAEGGKAHWKRSADRATSSTTASEAAAGTPGRRTLNESQSPEDPSSTFDLALQSARRKTAVLARAIGAVDYVAAWSAGWDLRNTLDYAEDLALATTAVRGDMFGRVRDVRKVRVVADPLLALAPVPSSAAIREVTDRRRPCETWNAEESRWRAAHGGLAATRRGLPPAAVRTTDARDPSMPTVVDLEVLLGRDADDRAGTDRAEDAPVEATPLPAAVKGDLERAVGSSLDHVRVHAGPEGDAMARSHDARAVAIGSDIYLGAGELEAPDAHQLLAHETAHTEQARKQPGPTQPAAKRAGLDETAAAEQEADAFAADFAVRRGAAAFTPAVGVSSGQALRSPAAKRLSHDQFEAVADNRVSQLARAGTSINAAAYLHHNARELRASLREYLIAHAPVLGDAQVRFIEGVGASGFAAALLAPLAGDDDSAHVRMLRSWLLPVDLDALVDRNRPIFEAADPKDGAEYTRGAKGPAGWCPAVAVAIGSAIEVGLALSLPRMAARLVAKTAQQRAQTHRADDQLRVPGQLVPSTPLDWQVAKAMIGAVPTVEVVGGALKVDPAARLPYRKLTKVEWQGDRGGPWNAVRVEPGDANAEEVAAELLHSAAEAYRLRRIGALYLLPDEAALAFPGAQALQLAQRLTGAPSSEEHVAFSSHAGAAVEAEIQRSFGIPTGRATGAALAQAWAQVEELLLGIASVVEPLGFDGSLDAAVAFHASRQADLPRLEGRDADLRARAFELQRALLAQVGAELGPLAQQLQGERAPADAADPRRRAIQRLISAASLSHLPELGRGILAQAHAAQEESLYATLEAILGQATTFIALTSAAPAARARASESVFGAGLRERAEALRGELAALRARATQGLAAASEVEDLHRQIEALRTDAELVAQIGALAGTFQMLDKLEDSGWVLFSEALTTPPSDATDDNRIGRLETARRGAAELRGALETAHSRWIKAQAHAVARGHELAAAGAQDAAAQGRAAVDTEVAAIILPLLAAGGHPAVQSFLHQAHDVAASAERRAMIVQIAVMVGAAIVSEGVGSFAEGLVAGGRTVALTSETAAAEAATTAARAAGSRALAAKVVGTATNTVTFTALQGALNGGPLLQSFASNFIGNFAAYAALRGTRQALAGITAGKAGIALWAARAANLTAPLVVSVAVQFVQQECETALREGRTMTWDELHAAGVQTMAMMIGSAIAHHVLGNTLEHAHDVGYELAAERAQRKQLEQLAADVSQGGNPTKALQLLSDTRTYLEKLLFAKGETTKERARRGINVLTALERDAVPAQLGLDVVVASQVYAGSHEAVTQVVQIYRGNGYTVEPSWEGYNIYEPHSQWSPCLRLIDRSSDRSAPRRPRSESTRPAPTHAAAEDAAATASPHSDASDARRARPARVEAPVPGWFDAVNPTAKVADWEISDFAQTSADGTHSLKTKVMLPDGSVGLMYQSYNPANQRLALRSVYLDQLPKWIAEGPTMVPGKGVPTITYLLNRQWKMLGVEYGGLKTVKLTSVEECQSVIEFAALTQEGVPADVAVLRTHTTAYAKTALVQAGHRIVSAKVKLKGERPLDQVLKRFESPARLLQTKKQRELRDPTIVARNDQLITTYGRGRVTRATPVQVDFDVEFQLAPFHGDEPPTQP